MEIVAEGLCKLRNGQYVLQNVSFRLGEGVVCVTGLSGTGKTALGRILLGLELPDSGSVRGVDRARVSAVFPEDRLLPELSAWENLRFVLGPAYDEPAAARLFAALGLGAVDAVPVGRLNAGSRRRVALARALLAPFDLLVLDEPFTGLDEEGRNRAAACILRYAVGRIVLLLARNETDAAALNASLLRLPPPENADGESGPGRRG
jgi:NitT/TauT family transport system ATP-binding protein